MPGLYCADCGYIVQGQGHITVGAITRINTGTENNTVINSEKNLKKFRFAQTLFLRLSATFQNFRFSKKFKKTGRVLRPVLLILSLPCNSLARSSSSQTFLIEMPVLRLGDTVYAICLLVSHLRWEQR